MTTSRRRFGSLSAALVALALVTGCSPSSTSSPSSPTSTASGSPATAAAPSLTATGDRKPGDRLPHRRLWTSPNDAEALLIEAGSLPASARGRTSSQGNDDVPVIKLGPARRVPRFIDAHAHWIGDREYYSIRNRRPKRWSTPSPRLDLDLRAVGQSRTARRADRLRRRRGIAAPRGCLPRVQLRQGVLRRLVRRSHAGPRQ